jgi:hypothetical protein
MSDLLRRAQALQSLTGDHAAHKSGQFQQALGLLSGLNVSAIEKEIWEPLERSLASINSILDGYDDFEQISEADAERWLAILHEAAGAAIEAELDRIVADLDDGIDSLPVEAIDEAREHRDLMVPRLIRVIRDATAAAREGDLPEGNAHFFALFLLSEFQAAESLPSIVEAISLPGELPEDLFDDAVTEAVGRILAQFAGDTPQVFDELIANPDVNEYVRWEAARAYLLLVRDGRMTRAEAAARLKSRLRWAIDREDFEITAPLINELANLAPGDAIELVREAFERDMVDTFTMSEGDFERCLADGEAGVQRNLAALPSTGIVDTIAELSSWASFDDDSWEDFHDEAWEDFNDEPPERQTPVFVPRPPVLDEQPVFSMVGPIAEPIVSHRAHTGRNDPCPCGSGKKFKKCCMHKAD